MAPPPQGARGTAGPGNGQRILAHGDAPTALGQPERRNGRVFLTFATNSAIWHKLRGLFTRTSLGVHPRRGGRETQCHRDFLSSRGAGRGSAPFRFGPLKEADVLMTRDRIWRLLALVLALATLLAACGSDNKDKNASGNSATSTAKGEALQATLTASGATFPLPFYQEAIAAF